MTTYTTRVIPDGSGEYGKGDVYAVAISPNGIIEGAVGPLTPPYPEWPDACQAVLDPAPWLAAKDKAEWLREQLLQLEFRSLGN